MSMQSVPILNMFPCLEQHRDFCGGLDRAEVTAVVVEQEALTMQVTACFVRTPLTGELRAMETTLCGEFGLASASILMPSPPEKKAEDKAPKATLLYGRQFKGKPVEISSLTAESGSVIVQGEVFAVENREIVKRKARVLSFDITDGTGSVRVSRFIPSGEDQSIVSKIEKGMYLTVQGSVSYNRYDEDITLEPRSILRSSKASRQDTAPEKRVELHLHTRFSALDALTDPTAAVKRAAQWGHPAIAVTDHGVAQSFPEIWNAGKKNKIKIIFGLEGYFLNDVDDRLAVHGRCSLPLDTEFVAFDIETTGLEPDRDRITEIGAAIFREGVITDRFSTMVNPGVPIPPEIVELTGITDRDVFDAPDEARAMRDFLAFAGNRPLIAHNADFDTGFMDAACRRAGIPFAPVYLDSLVIAQCLLPDMRRHKLDLVAARLGLPDFNHHRALDDGLTVAHMMGRFLPMLREQGCETVDDIEPRLRALRQSRGDRGQTRHIILLVKNKTGLKNLYELISRSHLEHYHKNPIIPKSLLLQHREGLIIGSACEAGEVFRALVDRKGQAELQRIAAFYDYLEIQPICNNAFMVREGKAKDDEALREYNRRIVALAESLHKPVAATGDVHFLDPEDEIYRHILQAARKFSDADASLPIYFRTTDEMLAEFAYLGPEKCREVVIDTPRAIADQCEDIELLPEGLFAPTIENSAQQLKDLVYGRMHELYGETPPEVVTSRVETEMDAILGRHYDVIYMSAQKLVADSLAHGYLVGSRGSVGSSIVAYMSGITEVNSLPPHYRCPQCQFSDFAVPQGFGCGADMPDRVCPRCGTPMDKDGFDIPFETFLGFGGDKVPDIDLNFSGEYQASAHKYTETLFGRDHVFKAGTIGTLAEKTAYGYVKKYLEERGRIVTKAEENRLALGLVGVKRTTGQHPGGLVIIPQNMDVTDFCPVQHPADDKDSDIITTHFEYHSMESNLLKLDELGHDDPTMIRMLEDSTGINARKIRFDDPETMLIFRTPAPLGIEPGDPIIGETGTLGIPEFGTGFARQMLVDIQPTQFNTLVRFVGFSHGTDVWLGNAKDLILSNTADVNQCVGCRDDIMIYLIAQGMEPKTAFKIMESVRKGKVKKDGFQDGWTEKMESLNVPRWYIDSLAKIAYLFPKAHAVAYVMMAFRIAWFKVHEPLAFYAAYFYRRSQKDAFDAAIMTRGPDIVSAKISEIRRNPAPTAKEEDLLTTLEVVYEFYRRGFDFVRIDLYQSDAARFGIVGDRSLRPPFVAISGLGEAAAADLASCREKGVSFVSVEDVSAACPKVSQTHLEQLRALGALGDLPETSQLDLFSLF